MLRVLTANVGIAEITVAETLAKKCPLYHVVSYIGKVRFVVRTAVVPNTVSMMNHSKYIDLER